MRIVYHSFSARSIGLEPPTTWPLPHAYALGYARLYDGTVATDYHRAMAEIESRFGGGENALTPPNSGRLLASVDALRCLSERSAWAGSCFS